jgi:glycosyltransferase involved in cell wall biosynthesis
MLAPSPHVRGPVGKHTLHLVEALEQLGCDVTLRVWGRAGDEHSALRRGLGRFTDAWSVSRLLRRSSFDVMVVKTAHDWSTLSRDLLLLTLCRRARVPVVVQFHGSDPTKLWREDARAFRLASRGVARLADALLVLSSDDQRAWSRLAPDREVKVVANPYVSKMAPGGVRTDGDGAARVLYVGRLIAEKGIFDLLEAGRLLEEPRPALVFAGDGRDREALAQAAEASRLNVTLAGYLEGAALQSEYAHTDVFALPTKWSEGFPTAIAEAMDAGLPIVTTPGYGMADHLEPEVNALFVPRNNPSALADALARLLKDGELRRRMGAANRQKVQSFSPERVAETYLAILENVVARRRAAS